MALTENRLRRSATKPRGHFGGLGIFEPSLLGLMRACRGFASTSTRGVDIVDAAVSTGLGCGRVDRTAWGTGELEDQGSLLMLCLLSSAIARGGRVHVHALSTSESRCKYLEVLSTTNNRQQTIQEAGSKILAPSLALPRR